MKEFMIPVDRAVRPVRATERRKLRMRQELLAHLTAVFEEERARLGDDAAAREEALRRFGEPAGLTRELQASVPLLERTLQTPVHAFDRFRVLKPLFCPEPAESELRYALRLAALWGAFTVVCNVGLYLVRMGGRFPPATRRSSSWSAWPRSRGRAAPSCS
jgi:hypothetical protein